MTSGRGHFGHGHGNVNWAVYAVFVVILIVIFLLICEISRRHRKNRRRYINGPTVTVTTTTQQSHLAASPQVIPPYPINPRHPTPASNAPAAGFAPHQAPYPTHAPSMPFPQGQTPYQSGGAPYPPAPYQSTDYSANPPPYDVAVAQPPINPPTSKDGYQKQAPYNPGYN